MCRISDLEGIEGSGGNYPMRTSKRAKLLKYELARFMALRSHVVGLDCGSGHSSRGYVPCAASHV
jgi:hypothetical protein